MEPWETDPVHGDMLQMIQELTKLSQHGYKDWKSSLLEGNGAIQALHQSKTIPFCTCNFRETRSPLEIVCNTEQCSYCGILDYAVHGCCICQLTLGIVASLKKSSTPGMFPWIVGLEWKAPYMLSNLLKALTAMFFSQRHAPRVRFFSRIGKLS